MTRSQEVYEKVNKLTESGTSRPDAFKQVAEELGIQVNSARGSFYSFSRGATGNGKSRPRRRETRLEDAVADARAALERSLDAIDREVEASEERARESAAEAKALKATAAERKQAISERLEALR
jgi:flagellar motility protein MotE (MotC chaperone)